MLQRRDHNYTPMGAAAAVLDGVRDVPGFKIDWLGAFTLVKRQSVGSLSPWGWG